MKFKFCDYQMASRTYQFCFYFFLLIESSKCQINRIVQRYDTVDVDWPDYTGHLISSNYACGISRKDNVIDHTWLARLKYQNGQYGCGGVLLNTRYVLTAASCVTGDIVDRLGELSSVTLFENSGNRLSTDYEIQETVRHSQFEPNNIHGQNDVALIRLAKLTNNRRSTPICMDGYTKIVESRTPYVAGWGQTAVAQQTNIRKLLPLKYYNADECQYLLAPYYYEVTSKDVCLGLNYEDYAEDCPADGGGVLVNKFGYGKWYLIGISSYNAECGHHEKPAVFTRLQSIIGWVENNLRA